MRLADLREILAGNCPLRATSYNDHCGVHYPQLGALSLSYLRRQGQFFHRTPGPYPVTGA
jgi:hypothetical protein